MLEIFLIKTLIVAELLANPKKPIQDTYYPSGVKEVDKYYPTDRPSKDYPLLKLDLTVYDPEYNKLEPGIYSVEYSPEFNALLVGDGQGIILKAPVIQVIKLSKKLRLPNAKIFRTSDKKIFINYKKNNLEVHSFLYLPEAILDEN